MKKPLLRYPGISAAVTEMRKPWDILWHRQKKQKDYLSLQLSIVLPKVLHTQIAGGHPHHMVRCFYTEPMTAEPNMYGAIITTVRTAGSAGPILNLISGNRRLMDNLKQAGVF